MTERQQEFIIAMICFIVATLASPFVGYGIHLYFVWRGWE